MDLRPTENYLLLYSATKKYKAEVKGATLVPSCTLLPYAGLTTRTLHPQFSKIKTVISILDLGYTRRDCCVIHEFLRFTSTRIVSVPTGSASCYTCGLLGYCSLSRLLLPAHQPLLLKAIISALRLVYISFRFHA